MITISGGADQTVGLLETFGVALVGGGMALLGVYLTNRNNAKVLKVQQEHNRDTEQRNLLRDRGEELYVITHKWLAGLTGYYMRRNSVMQGKISLSDCIDLDLKDFDSAQDISRLEMLMDVYFKQVRPAYDAVIAARTEMNKIGIAFERRYRGGNTDGAAFLQPYVAAQIEVEKTGDALKARIIDAIAAV